MHTIFVVDTSYLLELFAVPNFSTPESVDAVKEKFRLAIESRHQIVVPLGCIYELANHIADVPDGNIRNRLAAQLSDAVSRSLKTSQPWLIIPPDKLESFLPELLKTFSTDYVAQKLSLTDTATILEALRLKEKYTTLCKVHIWTKDVTLKAREPDAEEEPFCG